MPSRDSGEDYNFLPNFSSSSHWYYLAICTPPALVYNHLLTSLLHSVDKEKMDWRSCMEKKNSASSFVVLEKFYSASILAKQASAWRSPYIASSYLGRSLVLPVLVNTLGIIDC